LAKAVIDTGSDSSYVESSFALTELQLVPFGGIEATILQPGPNGMIRTPSPEVVRFFVTIPGDGRKQDIAKPIEAVLMKGLDPDPQIKIILGMDFLSDLDMAYFAGPYGATFVISQTL